MARKSVKRKPVRKTKSQRLSFDEMQAGFGRTGKNAVRLSFGPLVEQIDKIEQGIIKISNYLNESKPFLKTN